MKVAACGMVTHAAIAQRAANYYYQERTDSRYADILSRNRDALSSGAPFPDYLYTCGSDHDAGEAAHWPPFHAAAAQYIRSHKSSPWDNSTERLVAFMFGVVSHYIADQNWHGLVEVDDACDGYGFIQTLGTQNFACRGELCSVAHSAADTGGEFVTTWSQSLDWFLPLQWPPLPNDDLINIFAAVNHTVQDDWLTDCREIFQAASEAIKVAGDIIYQQETVTASYMIDAFDELGLGGLQDMAVWSGRMWNRFAEWLQYGPPTQEDASDVDAALLRPVRRSVYSKRYLQSVKALGDLLRDRSAYQELRQLTPHVDSQKHDLNRHTQQKATELESSIRRDLIQLLATDDIVAIDESETSSRQHAALHKLHKLFPQLRYHARNVLRKQGNVGAIASSTLQNISLSSVESTPTLTPVFLNNRSAEFAGAAVTFGDYNGDGLLDFVYGAPAAKVLTQRNDNTTSTYMHMQAGAVYVQLSSDDVVRIDLASSRNTTVATIFTEYARFGHALVTLDFNLDGVSDLVVAAPMSSDWQWQQAASFVKPEYKYFGAIAVFLGGPNFLRNHSDVQPDVIISAVSEQLSMMQLGSILSFGDLDNDGHNDLLVGCPYAHGSVVGQQQQDSNRGLVLGYYSSKQRRSGQLLQAIKQADVVVTAPQPFGQFGAAILFASNIDSFTTPVLFVGAPGQRNNLSEAVGAVHAYRLNSNDISNKHVGQQTTLSKPSFSIFAEQNNSRFGNAMAYGGAALAVRNQLAVTAPFADTQNNFLSGSAVAGKVFLIDLQQFSVQSGSVVISQIEVRSELRAASYAAKFGAAVRLDDVNNDGFADLLITAPLMDTPQVLAPSLRQAGMVCVWSGAKGLPKGPVNNAVSTADWTVSGEEEFGRLGESVSIINNNNVTVFSLLTAPRTRAYATELGGTVFRTEIQFDQKVLERIQGRQDCCSTRCSNTAH